MPSCPTSSAIQSIPSGLLPGVVKLVEQVFPEWFLYQQEVCTYFVTFHILLTIYSLAGYTLLHLTPAPPTPTGVTAQFTNASSVRVTWWWTSSGPAPDCFITTTVTYRPEGGSESFLQLRDPAANETTLTGLWNNTHYTITVVATAGGHRRESVARRVHVLFSLQGILQYV